MTSISKCASTDWIDHYFNAKWDSDIPAPPQGWGSDANELQLLEPLKQSSQKLFITVSHIQQYLSLDCWSWDLVTRTVSFKEENQTERKLFKLYQIILNIWQEMDSQRVNSRSQGFLFYDYSTKLPHFPFKIVCCDGTIELDCLQQVRLMRDSDYFKSLFTSEFSEAMKREVSYPDIPIKGLKNTIDAWCTNYVAKGRQRTKTIVALAQRFLLSAKDPNLKEAIEAALHRKPFYIKPLPICSERILPSWIDHYFQANWDNNVPAPLEGWSASEIKIFEENYRHRCAEQLSSTINRIKQYLWSKDWSWSPGLENRTINPIEESHKELKLFRLYQVILNIWKVLASRLHSRPQGLLSYECRTNLPHFPFKIICKDGTFELDCLQQAYLMFNSPYFEQLFTSPNIEAMKREISYPHISIESLKDTVDAWCTNRVEGGRTRAQALLKVADRFLLSTKDPFLKEAIQTALTCYP
jgi:hypothetical protein